MDKQTIRLAGIEYRETLSVTTIKNKSTLVSQNLRKLLTKIPGTILSYRATLVGELDPSMAYVDTCVIFIEARPDAPLCYEENFAVVVLPVVASDAHGHRIGMGGGWFDRLLQAHPRAISIGCCYDQMVLQDIPFEPHDVSLDYICTETKVIRCAVE